MMLNFRPELLCLMVNCESKLVRLYLGLSEPDLLPDSEPEDLDPEELSARLDDVAELISGDELD